MLGHKRCVTHTRLLSITEQPNPESRVLTGIQIADLESGRAVPNQQLLAKVERIVGVKLRGASNLIGTPLHAPKKK